MDGRFGGNDWEGELSNALVSAYTAESSETAYRQIGEMLEKLGDPFTRIVPPSCVPLRAPVASAYRQARSCLRMCWMRFLACAPTSLMHIKH